jgi:serine/threonine protein kinase
MRIEDRFNFNEVYLVMEFMQYNLKKLILSKNKISENMIKFIIYQILDGLYHMHSADIIHRDLKPENILINHKLELKIADMNLGRKEGQNLTKYVVTLPYRALEVLLCSRNYTKSIDIWSVGCIFAELIGKTVLFEGSNCINQFKRFVAILGKPKLELYTDVDPIVKDSFIEILKEMPDRAKIDWKTLFPNVSLLQRRSTPKHWTYSTTCSTMTTKPGTPPRSASTTPSSGKSGKSPTSSSARKPSTSPSTTSPWKSRPLGRPSTWRVKLSTLRLAPTASGPELTVGRKRVNKFPCWKELLQPAKIGQGKFQNSNDSMIILSIFFPLILKQEVCSANG